MQETPPPLIPDDLPVTWEQWQARPPEDRITLAAFRKYMRRAFDAGYDAGRRERSAMPRCETCAHWQAIPGGNFGYCHKLMADNTTVTDLVAFGEAFDAFRSRADFGCVLWQERMQAQARERGDGDG